MVINQNVLKIYREKKKKSSENLIGIIQFVTGNIVQKIK